MPPTRAEIATGLGFSTRELRRGPPAGAGAQRRARDHAGRLARPAPERHARRAGPGDAAPRRPRRGRQPDPRRRAHRGALPHRPRALRAARRLPAARARREHAGRRHPRWRPARRASARPRRATGRSSSRACGRRSHCQTLETTRARNHCSWPRIPTSRPSSSIPARPRSPSKASPSGSSAPAAGNAFRAARCAHCARPRSRSSQSYRFEELPWSKPFASALSRRYLVSHPASAARAIEFYQQAFGAEPVLRLDGPDGKVAHAELRDRRRHHHDVRGERGEGFREPADARRNAGAPHVLRAGRRPSFAQALAAGAKEERAVKDQFYGDRSGTLADPFGHLWTIATHVEDVSPRRCDGAWRR